MALSKKAKQRLTKLIKFMSSLPRSANKHFDMNNWADHSKGSGFPEHGIRPGAIVPTNAVTLCGTTACALGWACSVPSFHKAGLRLRVAPSLPNRAYPVFGRSHTEMAASRFFDIHHQQAEALFYMYDAKTPKAWAKGARKLVAQWSKAT
jgi:hypothetical protein